MKKKIVCYGDSNTYGYIPAGEGGRWAKKDRWCGVLADQLGDEYRIIEEGHNGRTTDLDVEWDYERNGCKRIAPVLEKYIPIDDLVIMLGTNDCKADFGRDENDIAAAMAKLIQRAQEVLTEKDNADCRIITVIPAVIRKSCAYGPFGMEFNAQSAAVSARMGDAYRKICEERGVYCFDASQYIEPDEADGIHLSWKAHAVLGEKLAEFIRDIS